MKTCNIFLSIGLWDEDHEYIMSNKKDIDTFVVLRHESDPNIPWNKIRYNLVLSGLTKESLQIYKKRDEVKITSPYSLYEWPTSMLHYNHLSITEKKNPKKSINNLYLNHTRRAHQHRVELLNQLYNHNLIDYGINTFINPEKDKDNDGVDYNTYPWYEYINNYDNSWQGQITQKYLNHDAAIEIVTETYVDFVRFTEKTWNPILNKHPFLILGGKGIHKSLYSLGFHLYEELFDYSFDEKNDEQQRIMGIVNNLRKLKKIKPHKIIRHVKNKVLDNYEKFLEYRNSDTAISQEFLDNISQYDLINVVCGYGDDEDHYPIKSIINSIKKMNIEFNIINREYK